MKDESALVERLIARFDTRSPHVLLGIGDDAAVVRVFGDSVLSVDVSVEGTHFRRAFAPLDVLAERAFHAAMSDLAAMGAAPSCVLVSLVLPADLDDASLDTLLVGLARAASELEAPIVGGNTSRGPCLVINTTVIGVARAKPLLRSGARVGDRVYVTGPTGDRALGLEILLRGASSLSEPARGAPFVSAWCMPRARIAEGLALAPVATSAIDISDGLAKDLHRVLDASGVGARLWADALPRALDFDALATALGLDPVTLLIAGGEAYELLFTAPPDIAMPAWAHPIGEIVPTRELVLDVGGQTRAVGPLGFDHIG